METEFRTEYNVITIVNTIREYSFNNAPLNFLPFDLFEMFQEMRQSVQDFAKSLLDHSRTSEELEIMLNYNSLPGPDVWEPGDHQSLDRLKLAINYKQKQFVAHPSVQQLLASIWYEGNRHKRCVQISKSLISINMIK